MGSHKGAKRSGVTVSVKICRGREWAWGGQGRCGSFDVVFGISAVLGNYLVSVCAGNWDV